MTFSKTFDFIRDEDDFPIVFEVNLFEEYGEGDYTVEVVDEYGVHSSLLCVSTNGPIKLPDIVTKRPEPKPNSLPTDHPFIQTFNTFHGKDMIVKRNGEILPLVIWVRFEITVDDFLPFIKAGVYRENK